MKLFKKAWDYLLGWLLPSRRPFKIVPAEDLPEVLRARRLYIVGEDGDPWCVGFLCPCGCGATVQLNVMREVRPCWDLTVDEQGRPTLFPSVRAVRGCRSHYWMRRGEVEWCDDSEGR